MVNPFGNSGSRMNPYLRAVICVATGITIGLLFFQLLTIVPRDIAAGLVGAAIMGGLIFCVQTWRWSGQMMRAMKEAQKAMENPGELFVPVTGDQFKDLVEQRDRYRKRLEELGEPV